jgi:hypothetical protein
MLEITHYDTKGHGMFMYIMRYASYIGYGEIYKIMKMGWGDSQIMKCDKNMGVKIRCQENRVYLDRTHKIRN